MFWQGVVCKGACYQLFDGKPCYLCHQVHGPDGRGATTECSFALDLGNAQCVAFAPLCDKTHQRYLNTVVYTKIHRIIYTRSRVPEI